MAKSKARKLRKKALREGKRDVTLNRGGTDISISLSTRKTKTKQEKIRAMERKHKHRVVA